MHCHLPSGVEILAGDAGEWGFVEHTTTSDTELEVCEVVIVDCYMRTEFVICDTVMSESLRGCCHRAALIAAVQIKTPAGSIRCHETCCYA